MPSHVALLRGINVGGHRKLPMAELREVCAGLGWSDVATYIQSGNVWLTAENPSAEDLATAIAARWGYDVPVILRSMERLRALAAASPWPDADPRFVHVVFLATRPSAEAAAALTARTWEHEEVRLDDADLWIHYRNGQGRSRLTLDWVERTAGAPSSGRNLKTLRRLASGR